MNIRALISKIITHEMRVELACKLLPSGYRSSVKQLARIPNDKKFAKEMGKQEVWNYDLRRVAHILEKGLCHPAWTPGHSTTVRNELEELLIKVSESGAKNDPSYLWAKSIIDEYDESQRAKQTKRNLKGYDATREGIECLDVLLRSRRSIRNYQDRHIDDSVLNDLIESVNWSSTSCNRQPARVYVVRSSKRVSSVMKRFAGSTGFSRNVPCALVFCADMRAYTMPMEMYLPSIDVSLGIQNLALKAQNSGLSLTLMSWAHHSDLDDEGLRRDLGIPEWEQIVVGGLLGYPATTMSAPGRKTVEQTAVIID